MSSNLACLEYSTSCAKPPSNGLLACYCSATKALSWTKRDASDTRLTRAAAALAFSSNPMASVWRLGRRNPEPWFFEDTTLTPVGDFISPTDVNVAIANNCTLQAGGPDWRYRPKTSGNLNYMRARSEGATSTCTKFGSDSGYCDTSNSFYVSVNYTKVLQVVNLILAKRQHGVWRHGWRPCCWASKLRSQGPIANLHLTELTGQL